MSLWHHQCNYTSPISSEYWSLHCRTDSSWRTYWLRLLHWNQWLICFDGCNKCLHYSFYCDTCSPFSCLSVLMYLVPWTRSFFNQVLIFKNRSLGLINQPLIKISVEDKSQFSELFFFKKNHKFITRCSIAVRNKVLGILQYTVQNYKEKPNQRCETKTRSLATEPDTREVRKGGERKGKKKQE